MGVKCFSDSRRKREIRYVSWVLRPRFQQRLLFWDSSWSRKDGLHTSQGRTNLEQCISLPAFSLIHPWFYMSVFFVTRCTLMQQMHNVNARKCSCFSAAPANNIFLHNYIFSTVMGFIVQHMSYITDLLTTLLCEMWCEAVPSLPLACIRRLRRINFRVCQIIYFGSLWVPIGLLTPH